MTISQKQAWEREYEQKRLVSGSTVPSQEVKNFVRYLRKTKKYSLEGVVVLDLGSGVGKQAHYMSEQGARVIGFEIAENALREARRRAAESGLPIEYRAQSMGEAFPLEDDTVDVILDVMSSNALTEAERTVYVRESHRVLRPGGHMMVRALCKDGDKNAQFLLKKHPWKERDTYLMPKSHFHERVFSEHDIVETYSAYFSINHKEKKHHYTRFEDRLYKRAYWTLYLEPSKTSPHL